MLNKSQIKQVKALRSQGFGYKKIADQIGATRDEVRYACKSFENVSAKTAAITDAIAVCQQCGEPLQISETGRPKKFCSDRCRIQYWSAHRDDVNKASSAVYIKVCLYCGKSFEAYGHKEAKYCCHEHAIAHRFGEENCCEI